MSLTTARVVLLPDTEESTIKLVNIPHPRTNHEHHYVLVNDQLYEFNEIDNDNPHSKTNHLRSVTKNDNKPVRSLILENSDSSLPGLVLEESNIIISTKFNFVYVLISYFNSQLEQGKEFRRYQSLQDLTDVLEEELPVISKIPESLLTDALEKISDSIDENGDKFYRYSEEKVYEFLKNKVEIISKSFPKSIQSQLVNPILYPVNIEDPIPENIINLALNKYSIHLISSYLHPKVESKLLDLYKFQELEAYITKVSEEKSKKKAAEDQIQNLNQINAQNKRTLGKQETGSRKKPTVTKKITPKVSKGPLDGFFGKKK
ncbi:unnamed protein product [Wickerhamomyces anomalus]